MTIIEDSREKKWQHISEYFARHNINYIVEKLDEGDYMVKGGCISVDRKQNLNELSRNIFNPKDHSRFWKEVRRCRDKGIKLYILCEHGGKIKSIRDVASWSDKYSGASGRSLMDALYKLHIAWGVEIIFCSKRSTGKKILEILSQEK